MQISAWWLLPAAIPVLYLGEAIVRRVSLLRRFSIPVPVVGGLLIAFVILAINLLGKDLTISDKVTQAWWKWIVTPEVKLDNTSLFTVYTPLVVAFFTCIGLNAQWLLAKKGGLPLLWFLLISSALCAAQNFLGVGLCRLLGENPLMGVLTGGVALTGGTGTALGMAQTFTNAGFAEASVVGLSAATFGLVGGSLIGGPVAALLIRIKNIATPSGRVPSGPGSLPPAIEGRAAETLAGDLPTETPAEQHATAIAAGDGEGYGLAPQGFLAEVRALGKFGTALLTHIAILLVCMKLGSWVSHYLSKIYIAGRPLSFPVYMGAMVLAILLRNIADLLKLKLFNTEIIEALSSILLAVFLAMTMVSLQLTALKDVAGSLLILLIAQMILMVLFAVLVTFPLMGRTYDAAVLTAGQIGFGLGATSNAVATMEATTRRYGPSPKSFLIVTIVGGFLIDVVNLWVTIGFLHWLK